MLSIAVLVAAAGTGQIPLESQLLLGVLGPIWKLLALWTQNGRFRGTLRGS